MLVSMIVNTSYLSALYLRCATAIFVVDGCQLGPSWIFLLKMELMACAGLVGGTTEESLLFISSAHRPAGVVFPHAPSTFAVNQHIPLAGLCFPYLHP